MLKILICSEEKRREEKRICECEHAQRRKRQVGIGGSTVPIKLCFRLRRVYGLHTTPQWPLIFPYLFPIDCFFIVVFVVYDCLVTVLPRSEQRTNQFTSNSRNTKHLFDAFRSVTENNISTYFTYGSWINYTLHISTSFFYRDLCHSGSSPFLFFSRSDNWLFLTLF